MVLPASTKGNLMSDNDFYTRDRPEHARLPEDRPRGGTGGQPAAHRGTWTIVLIILAIIVVAAFGIMFFP